MLIKPYISVNTFTSFPNNDFLFCPIGSFYNNYGTTKKSFVGGHGTTNESSLLFQSKKESSTGETTKENSSENSTATSSINLPASSPTKLTLRSNQLAALDEAEDFHHVSGDGRSSSGDHSHNSQQPTSSLDNESIYQEEPNNTNTINNSFRSTSRNRKVSPAFSYPIL